MKTLFYSILKILLGTMLFAGLPLVGWSVGDSKAFVSHPARLGYLLLVFILQIIVVLCFPGVGRSAAPGKKTVARQRVAVVLLQILTLSIVLGAPYCDRRQLGVLSEHEWVRFLGLVLVPVGLIAMSWAEATLGEHFSVQVTIQAGHSLITRGPYRYVRHPRYLGILLFSLGIALVFNSWWTILLVALLALVLLWRIHDEEALLHQEFGSSWEAYTQKSWRLIPFVY